MKAVFDDAKDDARLEIEADCGSIDVWTVGENTVSALICLDPATAREVAAHLVRLAEKLEEERDG